MEATGKTFAVVADDESATTFFALIAKGSFLGETESPGSDLLSHGRITLVAVLNETDTRFVAVMAALGSDSLQINSPG